MLDPSSASTGRSPRRDTCASPNRNRTTSSAAAKQRGGRGRSRPRARVRHFVRGAKTTPPGVQDEEAVGSNPVIRRISAAHRVARFLGCAPSGGRYGSRRAAVGRHIQPILSVVALAGLPIGSSAPSLISIGRYRRYRPSRNCACGASGRERSRGRPPPPLHDMSHTTGESPEVVGFGLTGGAPTR
jgi:hypothetical protein